MASVTKETRNGRTLYRVEYRDKDRRRRKVRLGAVAKKDAQAIASKIQSIVSADIAGESLPPATAHWLSQVGDDLHGKFATSGLCEPRDQSTLGQWLAKFISSRKGTMADKSLEILEQTKAKLIEHFGESRLAKNISPDDAQAFRNWLAVDCKYAQATVAGHIKKSKQFFIAAAKAKVIAENPFAEVVAGTQVNGERSVYVSVQTIQDAIEMAPDAQWRLIIALSRFGGLRCPSETLALCWADVDFEQGILLIRQGKTKMRIMPILPELRPYLEDAFDPENIRVISRYRTTNFNLRKVFLEILAKAKIDPWPRLFHNLRGSLETDLVNRVPLHVVCEWMGNSETIAKRHYLKTTQDHLDIAITQGVGQQVGKKPAAPIALEGVERKAIPLIPEETKIAGEFPAIEYTPEGSNL